MPSPYGLPPELDEPPLEVPPLDEPPLLELPLLGEELGLLAAPPLVELPDPPLELAPLPLDGDVALLPLPPLCDDPLEGERWHPATNPVARSSAETKVTVLFIATVSMSRV